MPSGFNLGTAWASIEIDASKTKSGMDNAKKSISGGLKDIGQSMTSLGTSVLGLTAPFVAFGAAAIKSFADSEATLSQLDAVLKSTGGTAGITRDMAISLAEGFQQVTTYSDEAVLSSENLLLTFTNISKDVFPDATRTILDMSTAMGQDLKTSAIQLGKALQDPEAGITALTRVGVNFSDAQKEAIKQMVAMGDTAGAQRLILQELQKEFGGSAEAAGKTFAGQLVILKNQLDNVMETIGAALIPVIQNLLIQITPILNSIAEWITKNPELIGQIAQVVIIAFGLGTALTVVGGIISTVATIVGVLTGAIGFLLSPVGLLIAGIVAIVYAASQLYPGGLMKLFGDAAAAARQLAILGLGFLSIASDFARQRLAELLNTILSVIEKVDELKNRLSAGVTGLGGIIGGVANGQFSIQQVINAVGAEINGGGKAVGGSVAAGVPYTVGERGAETFVPQVNGTIIPAGAGGGGMVINVQGIYANTEAGGRAAARGFAEELEDLFRGRGNG